MLKDVRVLFFDCVRGSRAEIKNANPPIHVLQPKTCQFAKQEIAAADILDRCSFANFRRYP